MCLVYSHGRRSKCMCMHYNNIREGTNLLVIYILSLCFSFAKHVHNSSLCIIQLFGVVAWGRGSPFLFHTANRVQFFLTILWLSQLQLGLSQLCPKNCLLFYSFMLKTPTYYSIMHVDYSLITCQLFQCLNDF